MRVAQNWKDYELIDATDGERLERFGDVLLIRPDPQIIWHTPRGDPRWESANARYLRSKTGGGHWEMRRKTPECWQIRYGELHFNLKPMGFKHTGIFPEQAVNWDLMAEKIRAAGRPIRVLNLFGYTGAATLACVAAGAHVTHVDASKGMVNWGRENAVLSGLAEKPMRWLVDDCGKFVQRELRRGNTYDAIVMDPPSYGRGPGGEVWKLEDQIYALVEQCVRLLSDQPLFFLINSYTTGLSPAVMQYILATLMKTRGGITAADDYAHGAGGTQKRRRLAVLQRVEARAVDRFSFAFEVDHLSADHTQNAGGIRQRFCRRHHSVSRHILCRKHHLKGARQQRVARQECHRLAESDMCGGFSAAQRTVVHAGQIVMHQRIAVDHFHAHSERQRSFGIAAAQAAEFHREHRTDAFSAVRAGIGHCPHHRVLPRPRFGKIGRQRLLKATAMRRHFIGIQFHIHSSETVRTAPHPCPHPVYR